MNIADISSLKKLGTDFWLFRGGQFLSSMGSSLASIAIMWWLIEKPHSAEKISMVVFGTTVAGILGILLMAPLGDRYSRKMVAIWGDLLSSVLSLILFGVLYFNYFHLPLLIFLLCLMKIALGIFNAGARGIVMQLVPKDCYGLAQRTTTSLNALSMICGSAAGGLVVSLLSSKWAILVDALTFMVAALITSAIRSDTRIKNDSFFHKSMAATGRSWARQMIDGLAILFKIDECRQVLLLCLFINMAISPLDVVIPLLVKDVINLPAWYLGALQTSMGLGSILGAIVLGSLSKLISKSLLTYLSIVLFSTAIILLSMPLPAVPLIAGFMLGIGLSMASSLLITPFMNTIPDAFRSSVLGSLDGIIASFKPLGVMATGLALSRFNTSEVLWMSGGTTILFTLILISDSLSRFLSLKAEDGKNFFAKNYELIYHERSNQSTDPNSLLY